MLAVRHHRYSAVSLPQVRALLEVQADTLESTKRQVEKKQTRTVEERDQEIREEEHGTLPEMDEVRLQKYFNPLVILYYIQYIFYVPGIVPISNPTCSFLTIEIENGRRKLYSMYTPLSP